MCEIDFAPAPRGPTLSWGGWASDPRCPKNTPEELARLIRVRNVGNYSRGISGNDPKPASFRSVTTNTQLSNTMTAHEMLYAVSSTSRSEKADFIKSSNQACQSNLHKKHVNQNCARKCSQTCAGTLKWPDPHMRTKLLKLVRTKLAVTLTAHHSNADV